MVTLAPLSPAEIEKRFVGVPVGTEVSVTCLPHSTAGRMSRAEDNKTFGALRGKFEKLLYADDENLRSLVIANYYHPGVLRIDTDHIVAIHVEEPRGPDFFESAYGTLTALRLTDGSFIGVDKFLGMAWTPRGARAIFNDTITGKRLFDPKRIKSVEMEFQWPQGGSHE